MIVDSDSAATATAVAYMHWYDIAQNVIVSL